MAGNELPIELRVKDPRQLFNSLDPSPFRAKDLDDDAEEYMRAILMVGMLVAFGIFVLAPELPLMQKLLRTNPLSIG